MHLLFISFIAVAYITMVQHLMTTQNEIRKHNMKQQSLVSITLPLIVTTLCKVIHVSTYKPSKDKAHHKYTQKIGPHSIKKVVPARK